MLRKTVLECFLAFLGACVLVLFVGYDLWTLTHVSLLWCTAALMSFARNRLAAFRTLRYAAVTAVWAVGSVVYVAAFPNVSGLSLLSLDTFDEIKEMGMFVLGAGLAIALYWVICVTLAKVLIHGYRRILRRKRD